MCVKGRDSKKVPVGDFGVCVRYAPGGFLVRLLIPPFNDLGLIHGDMRRGYAPAHTGPIASQYDCRNDWGMRRICAGHKLGIPENSRRQNDIERQLSLVLDSFSHRKNALQILDSLYFIRNRICAGVCALYIYTPGRNFMQDMRPLMRPIYIYARRRFQGTTCDPILNF